MAYSLPDYRMIYRFNAGNADYKKDFIKRCNLLFEQEKFAYRFVDDLIVPITNQAEISEIEQALNAPKKYSDASEHIKKANTLFAARPKPDYANSIKESICAVESVAKIITQNDKATLGEALTVLKNKYGLHPALAKGFKEIYGYTSDEGGIRHSLKNKNANITDAEARFMLVSCSAFTNYLIAKAEQGE